VTFDETAPCPRDVVECAGDKEIDKSIFVDEGLQDINGDEDELYFHIHHHPSLFLLLHLKQRLLRLSPPPQQQQRRHGLSGRSSLSRELPLTFRRHIHLSRS
jgi:hypothetical protein